LGVINEALGGGGSLVRLDPAKPRILRYEQSNLPGTVGNAAILYRSQIGTRNAISPRTLESVDGWRRMQRVRIVVADNHEIVRIGLRSVLESQPGYEVCGDAASGEELVEKEKRLSPDIVIMELSLRGLSGLNAAREILHCTPHQKILALTRCSSETLAQDALQVGIRGLLLKSDALVEVLAALPAIVKGRLYFTRRISEMLLQGYLRRDESCATDGTYSGLLTPRENEIVKAIACGMTNGTISKILGISSSTVETHRCNIMRKLDLHSVTGLLLYAVRNRLLSVETGNEELINVEDKSDQAAIDSVNDACPPAHELKMTAAAALS
jgi:DNA-binding NarL/FixJ family response regulator